MVDAKMMEQKVEIDKIKETIKSTDDNVKEIRENQEKSEIRIKKEIEGTLKTSSTDILSQMSSMFQKLQSSLSERLDKIESKEDTESQESKRQKRQS